MEVQGSDVSYTHLTDVHVQWIFMLLSRVHVTTPSNYISMPPALDSGTRIIPSHLQSTL